MELLYNLSSLATVAVIAVGVVGLVKPKLFNKPLKKFAKRPHILVGALVLTFALASIVSATEPASVKQERLDRENAALQAQQLRQEKTKAEAEARNKETTKEVVETETIEFNTVTKEDSSLAKGKTKILQVGRDGSKKIIYIVTYKGDEELDRVKKGEVVVAKPVNKIVALGTLVPSLNCPNGTYTNSFGNVVCSPYQSSSAPSGATAKCRDGTYSFSQSRSGTCSYHGGVAIWL